MSGPADEPTVLSLADLAGPGGPGGPEDGEGDGGTRWAFGTGFEDPLHGTGSAVPAGVDAAELAACCLALGDDALIAAQRLAQWCTRAPELEVEVALANIGLDLLGQARLLYSRTGQADGTGRGEDAYAYARGPAEFRNVRLAELPDEDFACCVARLLVLSCWRLALLGRLAGAPDPVLAAVAAKGERELAYHRRFAAAWTVRLGDGTEESHRRMRAALRGVAPYLEELFAVRPGFGADPAELRRQTLTQLGEVLGAAGLALPAAAPLPGPHGRDGGHTAHLAPLLDELQSVARAHPGAAW